MSIPIRNCGTTYSTNSTNSSSLSTGSVSVSSNASSSIVTSPVHTTININALPLPPPPPTSLIDVNKPLPRTPDDDEFAKKKSVFKQTKGSIQARSNSQNTFSFSLYICVCDVLWRVVLAEFPSVVQFAAIPAQTEHLNAHQLLPRGPRELQLDVRWIRGESSLFMPRSIKWTLWFLSVIFSLDHPCCQQQQQQRQQQQKHNQQPAALFLLRARARMVCVYLRCAFNRDAVHFECAS